jgi:hypothetical protein
MRKTCYTILFIGCLFSAFSAAAQHKTFLKVNPTTLLNEVDVYFSHEISRTFSIEAGGGFVFTDYWDNILNQFDFGQIKPNISEHQYLNAKGFATRLGFRCYVISPYANRKAGGTYFEPMLLFKKIWYPHNNKEINAEDYIEKGIKYVSGLQLLIGRQYKWNKIYIDKYVGLGVKAKTYSFDNFKINQNSGEVQNQGQRTTCWLPDIKLGIKFAFDL